MGFFDFIFGKKEVVEKPVVEYTEISTQGIHKCHSCGMDICETQRTKTFGGKKFHMKPCWRQFFKDAKKMGGLQNL